MDDGILRLDRDAVPDEFILLRSCSSLVRKSASGQGLELAHFTVKEFLLGIEPGSEFSAYRVDAEESEVELGKACLTYLTLQEFNARVSASREAILKRRQEYAFRHYAVRHWLSHARGRLGNPSLLALIQKLLDPSQPRTFITWAQDYQSIYFYRPSISWPTKDVQKAHDERATHTPLHCASALALPEICTWLLDCGCKVDHMSIFGTPLHHALSGDGSITSRFTVPNGFVARMHKESILKVVDILLEAGADPNSKCSEGKAPLYCAFSEQDLILRLLKKGARYTDENAYPPRYHPSRARELLKMIGRENLHEDDYAFLRERALEEEAKRLPWDD